MSTPITGSTPVTGRCLCGAVRFSIAGPPLAVRACWCRDCQYLSAGNASVNLIVAAEGVAVDGDTATHVGTADSGNTMTRRFCPRCGTPLFSRSSARPTLMVIRAGALDDPEIAKPQGFIWTDSAPSWGFVDDGLANCVGQPAPVART